MKKITNSCRILHIFYDIFTIISVCSVNNFSEEGILGMRPDFYGLTIAPAIPKEWESFEIEKTFRGKQLHI